MKKVSATILATLTLMALLVLGFGGNAWAADGSKGEIGIVFTSLNNPVFAFMKDKMEAKVKELGYTPVTLDSQEKSDVELQNVQNLVSKKVAAICILPVNADSAINTVKTANDAGIPVVGWNRVIDTKDKCKFVTQVVTDNKTGAIEAGKLAVKLLANTKNPEIAILRGTPGIDADIDRSEGFYEGIKGTPLEKTIVAEQAAEFERQKGFAVTQNILQAHPDVNLIYALNDEMALGALQALQVANKTGVFIIGYDGSEECVAEIANGKVTATVAQQFANLGTSAVEWAVKATEGSAGSVEPVIAIGTEMVTAENAKGYVFK
ncbi:MAG: sugar ABC transporter substrate-binding protein [Synergistaceae bacterium]|nr:sugar ABC transporter substrate-binding protein [Synergistaceae bacterium]